MLTGKRNPIKHFDATMALQNLKLRDDDFEWLKSLPLTIELQAGWWAIHAGLETNRTFQEQRECQALLRTRFLNDDGTAYTPKDDEDDPVDRKWFWADRWRGPERIVYGHHIHGFKGPRFGFLDIGSEDTSPTLAIGIDTGCYAGGQLTCMVLEDEEEPAFCSVIAHAVYQPLSTKYGVNPPKPMCAIANSIGGG